MMQKLSFLTGEWIGTSTIVEKDSVVNNQPAFEKIQFGLDGHILIIDLDSESLQLHTIITFNTADKSYYYHPFYKTGTALYPAELKNGQLVVKASDSKRFVFGLTEDGKFREYGEEFRNGEWVVYFNDLFSKTE